MKNTTLVLVLVSAISLGLSACDTANDGDRQKKANAQTATTGLSAATTPARSTAEAAIYTAAGSVTAVSEDEVSIAHGPVAPLGWPAMTMTFHAENREQILNVKRGDKVRFSFRQNGNRYVLTSIRPQ